MLVRRGVAGRPVGGNIALDRTLVLLTRGLAALPAAGPGPVEEGVPGPSAAQMKAGIQ